MSEAGGAVRSIKIIWELVDRVTAPARKVNEQVDRMLGKGGEVVRKYQETTTNSSDKVVQAYQNAEAAVNNYTGGLKSRLTAVAKDIEDHRLAIAGIGAAFAGAGYLGLNYYNDGTQSLATYMDAYDALSNKLGANTDSYIQQLKEMSGYQLTEKELVTKANMALLLGIPEDALPKMTEMARAAGRQLEGSMSYYYQSIMTGTARESKLWLDNLGILVDLDDAKQNYAKTLGISADALTTEQEKIAFINEVLAHADDLTKDVDFSQDSLKETLNKSTAAWEDLQTAMAEGALPVISATANANSWLADTLNAMPGPMKTIVGTGGLVLSTIAGVTGTLLIQLAALSLIIPAWGTYKAQILAYVPSTISAAIATGTLTGALGVLGTALWAIATNPITLFIMGIVGAVWLLWDVFDKGWDDSMLGQTVAWLYDTFPWLESMVDGFINVLKYLRDALAVVWDYLQPIVDAITGVLENPVIKTILDAMWATTPMGMYENAQALVNGQEIKLVSDIKELGGYTQNYSVEDLTERAAAGSNGGTTVVYQNPNITVDASLNTGDLKTEGVTTDDLNALLDKRDRNVVNDLNRSIKLDFKSQGV